MTTAVANRPGCAEPFASTPDPIFVTLGPAPGAGVGAAADAPRFSRCGTPPSATLTASVIEEDAERWDGLS